MVSKVFVRCLSLLRSLSPGKCGCLSSPRLPFIKRLVRSNSSQELKLQDRARRSRCY